ncbi:MAG TPA: hypothetical protein VMT42_03830 [candidate division Zixibacteria bacterium]|nr:hypothetical protein [candidate division Zixibacteria bacterium]
MAKTSEKGKEKSKAGAVTTTNLTTLEQICGPDKDTYQALSYMFLDPRKIDVSMKEAFDKAKKAEKGKDLISARMWYEVAGGLAIYEGDTEKVAEYYGDAERITGEKYLIVNNPDKAVAKAQEYYKQYLTS